MTKSLEQFRKWALATGSVANPDGSYPGECASLIQQYLYQVFDIPYAPRGNAKDFVPPNFKKRIIGAPRPGDIIRYGANYGDGSGHIGLMDNLGKWLDQNGVKSHAVGEAARPPKDYESIWRPTKAFIVKGLGSTADYKVPKQFINYMNEQGFSPMPQEPENYITAEGVIAKRPPIWVRDDITLSDESARELVEKILGNDI